MPGPSSTYPIIAALLTVSLPLVASLLCAIAGKRAKHGIVSTVTISLSLLLAAYVFAQVWEKAPIQAQWQWFAVGTKVFHAGLLIDNVGALMLLLVPTIALPVHAYSMAYMKDDPGIHRYWMFLSFFCSAMLGLVIADNLLLMYVCWELVGVASYLLIGFWFTKESAAQANKKALLFNRIGDLGFLIGIGIIYAQFGTLDLDGLFGSQGLVSQSSVANGLWLTGSTSMPTAWLTAAGLAFFVGAMAKSAQFPLHAWLPDAMEGPTSISSLIHAATMVAAGVFLLVRVFPVFDDQALTIIAAIGTFTALIAAYFALTQYDIKKILAFSTISQLGFMVAAVGIGAYGVAVFHLVTHAFFKCLLFLAAGAIIHEMQHLKDKHQVDIDPQDIRNMGGLRRYMPVTFIAMLIGSLALAGVPLTSGYLSKDALLVFAFEWGALQSGWLSLIPYVLVSVSALTAFYISRLVFKVFFFRFRFQIQGAETGIIHEANWKMLAPMITLAICSLYPIFSLNPFDYAGTWLLGGMDVDQSVPALPLFHTLVPVLATASTAISVILAWRWYVRGKYPLRPSGLLYRLSFNQGYIDGFYQLVVISPTLKLAQFFAWIDLRLIDGFVNGLAQSGRRLSTIVSWADRHVVDGLVNLMGKIAFWLGNVLRRSQTGRIQYYMFTMFFIVLMVMLYHLISRA